MVKKQKKKAYLRLRDSKMVIAMLGLLYKDQKGGNISTVQRTGANEGENGFLDYPLIFPDTAVLQRKQ